MTSVVLPNATHTFTAPPDWDDEYHGPCVALSVIADDGVMYSYWRLSWRERFRVLFGRPIRLAIVGQRHPAVAVDTER